MKDGVKNQRRNPEVPVDLLRTSSLLNEQVFALKALTNLLKNAYQGLDVEWDMEEVFHGGESSGAGPMASSGDGSGEEEGGGGGGGPDAVESPGQTQSPPSLPPPPIAGTAFPAATTTTPSTVRTSVVDADGDTDGGDGDNVTDGDDDSSAGHKPGPTLRRALAAYLLPVVAVWFGGSFLEWIL